VPNLDGRIEAAELMPAYDVGASFLLAPAGELREVLTAGVPSPDGTLRWDLGADYASDVVARFGAQRVAGAWFAASFPSAQFAVADDPTGALLAVYRLETTGLFLLGFASREMDPPEGRTLWVYQTPVLVFQLPLEPGASWVTVSEVRDATVRGVPKDKVHTRIMSACDMCGLTDRIAQVIGTLSKGYKQRVGLAQALIHDPDILILDEPTSGLDPNQIVEIRNLIKKLGENRTIILSTHNLPEVMATCTRILIIHQGRLVADGTAPELEEREAENERLKIELRGVDSEVARLQLGALEGVRRAEIAPSTERNVTTIELEAPRGGDLRSKVYRKAVEAGWDLLGLTRMTLDLEGLFRKLTREV
jgi:ABC-type multidrug transport system ATPase subunit